jgi:hypothetical protein
MIPFLGGLPLDALRVELLVVAEMDWKGLEIS